MEQQKIPLKTTIHFEQLQNSTKRISVFQGGTRSAKTYNILIWIIIYLCQTQNKIVTICRETLPSLRGTAMRDFFEILESIKLYDVKNHNKTNNEYTLNKNLIEFISIDESQKIRGRKRNILFINEANEINKEAWLQLAFRTTDKIILDYNPSDETSFIYDDILTRDDCELFVSTFLDNPFLSDELINEIKRLKDTDENYWRIYGLGQRGVSQEKIYSNYFIPKIEDYPKTFDEIIYGLDFGYHTTALLEIGIKDSEPNNRYIRELMYKTECLNSMTIKYLEENNIDKSAYIYGDTASPDKIEEISNAGFNIHPSDKSVEDGIDYCKRMKLILYPESVNLIRETKSYSWVKDKNGVLQNKPVKFRDHCPDAFRYPIYTHSKQSEPNIFFI